MSFLTILRQEIKAIAETFSVSQDRAFAVWFAKLELDLDDDDAFDALSVEGANDKGMDLFWVDHPNQRVFIGQCKYSSKGTHRPKVTHLESLLSCTDWLASPEALEREGRPELVSAAREYLDSIERDFSVQLWFVYCGERDENIDKRVRVFNVNPENEQKRRMARHCDLRLLESMYEEARGEGRRIAQARIKVDEHAFEVTGTFGKGLVTTISGTELVRVYDEFGDKLFDRNVRLFLDARKGSVNAGIIDTVETDKERGNFWAYNNGITIVSDEYEHDPKTGSLELSNFSIVNGCQTTVALARSRESITEDVRVLVRLICPPESIIDSIIRFTNSQNQIRRWDIASQDRTQRRLQRDFEGLSEPVYYVLRRGDWQALEPAKRQKFRGNGRGSERTAKHDLLAQYLASFSGNPVVAYKNKAFLFTRYYDETFPADLRVEEALFVWRAGERTQQLVREEIRSETEQGREKYVLMLKRGGRFYALAVFGLLANLRNGPDYLRSITEARITSKAANERMDKYARIAIVWYKQAVDDLLQITGTDLSVLIRQPDFFDRVAERISNTYTAWAVNEEWLQGALPRLY